MAIAVINYNIIIIIFIITAISITVLADRNINVVILQ